FSLSTNKYFTDVTESHFITEDGTDLNVGEGVKNVYSLRADTDILAEENGDVQLAASVFGEGRSVYVAGLPYSTETTRLLLRVKKQHFTNGMLRILIVRSMLIRLSVSMPLSIIRMWNRIQMCTMAMEINMFLPWSQVRSNGRIYQMDKALQILKVVFFLVCMAMIVLGQRTIGKIPLLIQLIGLAGLLFLLWNYNRKYV